MKTKKKLSPEEKKEKVEQIRLDVGVLTPEEAQKWKERNEAV